jgi:predicted lipoprotein with Yx(FWY)xxD motif
VGSKWGASTPRRSLSGVAGAAALAATGGIHLDLYLTGYRSIPTIGWLFLLQVIAAFALAVAVLAAAVPGVPATVRVIAALAGGGFALATLGGYLLSLRIGLFGFREVRTTAGIVAGIIDVAAFAALAAVALAAVPERPSALLRGYRALPAVALICVISFALLGADVAAAPGGAGAPGATAGQVLRAEQVNGAMVLANSGGLTLYWFAPDTPTASRCTGTCAAYWPPLYGKPTAGTGITGTLGTITRPDGTTQATWNGHPLYTYVGDTAPGQASGNNLDLNGGLWHDVPLTT